MSEMVRGFVQCPQAAGLSAWLKGGVPWRAYGGHPRHGDRVRKLRVQVMAEPVQTFVGTV